MNERHLQLFPDHCRHYRPRPGMKYECALGVDIRKHVGGPYLGWVARMPCSSRAFAKPGCETVECDKHERPTAEEVKRDEAISEEQIALLLAGTCPECKSAMVRWPGGSRCPKCADVYTRECRIDEAALDEECP